MPVRHRSVLHAIILIFPYSRSAKFHLYLNFIIYVHNFNIMQVSSSKYKYPDINKFK